MYSVVLTKTRHNICRLMRNGRTKDLCSTLEVSAVPRLSTREHRFRQNVPLSTIIYLF